MANNVDASFTSRDSSLSSANWNLNERQARWLLCFEFVYAFLFSGLRDLFSLPSGVSYALDILNLLVLLLFAVHNKKFVFLKKNNLFGVLLSILFILFCVSITAVFNLVSFLLFAWGIRNFFRFFIFFFAFIFYFDNVDLSKIHKFLFAVNVLNFVVTIIQFFVFKISRDQLGGVFGCTTGVNSFTNILLSISLTLSFQLYFHKKSSFLSVLLFITMWMFIAALSELKIAFIEIPLIAIMTILLNRPGLKSLVVVFASIIAIFIGVNILVSIFPEWASSFFSLESLVKVGFETGGGYNISRLNAYHDINLLFFDNSVSKNVFGLGFGNCEFSSFEFFVSDFYLLFGHYNYRWFTNQMLFLESGYLGIVSYFLFFLSCFVWFVKAKTKSGDKSGYGNYAIIYLILLIFNFVYNSSFSTEAGYLAFFGLALPFIHYKTNNLRSIQ